MKKFGMLFLGILMAFGTANATIIDFSLPGVTAQNYVYVGSPWGFNGLTISSNYYGLTRYEDGLGVKGPLVAAGQDSTEIDAFSIRSDEWVKIVGANINEFTASRLQTGEIGKYSYDGNNWTPFFGDSDGFVSVVLNPTSTLYLMASDSGCDSDFSVKNVSVPEPATMLLLGLGLFTLAGIKRKMK